jgi:hypothetical protein
MKFKFLAFLLTAVASASLLAYGLIRGEIAKVLFNGALL